MHLKYPNAGDVLSGVNNHGFLKTVVQGFQNEDGSFPPRRRRLQDSLNVSNYPFPLSETLLENGR